MVSHVAILYDLAHLGVEKCVSDYHFFILDVFLEALAFE
jgi:hypothetical protein